MQSLCSEADSQPINCSGRLGAHTDTRDIGLPTIDNFEFSMDQLLMLYKYPDGLISGEAIIVLLPFFRELGSAYVYLTEATSM